MSRKLEIHTCFTSKFKLFIATARAALINTLFASPKQASARRWRVKNNFRKLSSIIAARSRPAPARRRSPACGSGRHGTCGTDAQKRARPDPGYAACAPQRHGGSPITPYGADVSYYSPSASWLWAWGWEDCTSQQGWSPESWAVFYNASTPAFFWCSCRYSCRRTPQAMAAAGSGAAAPQFGPYSSRLHVCSRRHGLSGGQQEGA